MNSKGFTVWFTGIPCSGKSTLAKMLHAHLGQNGCAITAAISPYENLRAQARDKIRNFIEVYVNCPLEVCIQRDVKGHYAKAQKGELLNFTGISDPYEPPLAGLCMVNVVAHSRRKDDQYT